MSRFRNWSLLVLSASALTLSACSSSPGNGSSAATTTPTTPPAAGPPTTAPSNTIATIPAADLSPAGTSGTAPTVVVPSDAPPTQLESADPIV
jgi:hypothetical protein